MPLVGRKKYKIRNEIFEVFQYYDMPPENSSSAGSCIYITKRYGVIALFLGGIRTLRISYQYDKISDELLDSMLHDPSHFIGWANPKQYQIDSLQEAD